MTAIRKQTFARCQLSVVCFVESQEKSLYDNSWLCLYPFVFKTSSYIPPSSGLSWISSTTDYSDFSDFRTCFARAIGFAECCRPDGTYER